MANSPSRSNLLLAFTCVAAVVAALLMSRVHAEPQPAVDRSLVERVVRAQEAQVRAQEAQLRALDALVRATEKCRR